MVLGGRVQSIEVMCLSLERHSSAFWPDMRKQQAGGPGMDEGREAGKILVQLFRRHVLQHPFEQTQRGFLAATRARLSLLMTSRVGRLVSTMFVGELAPPRGENALIDVEPDKAVRFEVIDEERAQAQRPAAVIDDCFVWPIAISEQSFERATGARDAARL